MELKEIYSETECSTYFSWDAMFPVSTSQRCLQVVNHGNVVVVWVTIRLNPNGATLGILVWKDWGRGTSSLPRWTGSLHGPARMEQMQLLCMEPKCYKLSVQTTALTEDHPRPPFACNMGGFLHPRHSCVVPCTSSNCKCVNVAGYTLLGLSMRWISEKTKRQLCRKS